MHDGLDCSLAEKFTVFPDFNTLPEPGANLVVGEDPLSLPSTYAS